MTDPVTTDGDRVAVVEDKSGNGVHLRQSTAASRPEYRTDGTHHWLFFDGSNYVMVSDSVSFSQPNSRGFVFEMLNIPGSVRPMIDGITSGGRNYTGVDSDGRFTMWADSFRTGHYVNLEEKDYCVAVFDGANSEAEHVKGGTKGNSGTRASSGLTVGSHRTGSPKTECKIFEIAEFNRELTAQEKADLKEYYEDTYSIDKTPKDFEMKRLPAKSTSTVLYGVIADNAKLYAPSFSGSNSNALTIDTADDSLGSVSLGVDFAGAGTKNGKVYAAPFAGDANQEIGVVDTSDDSTYTLAIPGKTASNRFYGQSHPIGDFLYFSPYEGGKVLRIDTSTDTVDLYGDTLDQTGSNTYGSNVVVGDLLYITLRAATSIQVFDTTDGTHTSIDASSFGAGSGVQWIGGVLAGNGKIYCTPRDNDSVLVIDTADNSLSSIPTGLTGSDKFNGQELLPNGLVAMFPRSADQVLLIDPSDDSVRFARIIYNGGTEGDINIGALGAWVGSDKLPSDNNIIYSSPFNAGYPVKWTSLVAFSEVTGSGELQAQAAQVSGEGSVTSGVTGSGELQAGQATVSGTAERELTGVGALQAGQATVSGIAERELTGVGALQAGQAVASGSGVMAREATGALQANTAVVVGAGAAGSDIVGSGEVRASLATVSGVAERELTGAGVLMAEQAFVEGAGSVGRDASGALQAQPATMEGEGSTFTVITGSGEFQAPQAVVGGTGAREVSGAGALQANPAVITANAHVGLVASGALRANAAGVTAQAKRIINGVGALHAAAVGVKATIWSRIDTSAVVWIDQGIGTGSWTKQ